MKEFGHIGVIGPGFCADKWGVGPFVIHAGGKKFRFEDSDRFGPTTIRKDGEPTTKQPDERSVFWPAYKAWRDNGRAIENDDVTCKPPLSPAPPVSP